LAIYADVLEASGQYVVINKVLKPQDVERIFADCKDEGWQTIPFSDRSAPSCHPWLSELPANSLKKKL